jgi:hypothetical protein
VSLRALRSGRDHDGSAIFRYDLQELDTRVLRPASAWHSSSDTETTAPCSTSPRHSRSSRLSPWMCSARPAPPGPLFRAERAISSGFGLCTSATHHALPVESEAADRDAALLAGYGDAGMRGCCFAHLSNPFKARCAIVFLSAVRSCSGIRLAFKSS